MSILVEITLANTCYSLGVFIFHLLVQVKTIEQFSLDLCLHFLTSFNHVLRAKVHMEEAPWRRLEKVNKLHQVKKKKYIQIFKSY